MGNKLQFFSEIPKTDKKAQPYGKLAVQQRFRLAMAFLNPLRYMINECWSVHTGGNKSKAFGRALKKLLEDALEGNYPDQRINPGKFSLSRGMLPLPQVDEVVFDGEVLEVRFSGEPNPMSRNSDEIVLVVYSPELGMAGRNTVPCKRSDGAMRLEIPVQLKAHAFHVYLLAHKENRKTYSNSLYLGSF